MPYIERGHRRGQLTPDPQILPVTSGELNFVISSTVDDYIQSHGMGYATLNEVIGVLECAKLELYRRIAAPYEDQKLKENGDVYTVNLER